MNPGDTFSALVWAGLILLLILVNVRSPKSEKIARQLRVQKDEERKSIEEAERIEELQFIAKATSLLPDLDSALLHLKTRYDWQELIATTGLSCKHRELLLHISAADSIELPNMRRSDRSPEEQRLFTKTYREATESERKTYYGEELYADPTVATLRDLEHMGLVRSQPKPNDIDREYQVSLTPLGEKLLNLDMRCKQPSPIRPKAFFKSSEAHAAISRIFRSIQTTQNAP